MKKNVFTLLFASTILFAACSKSGDLPVDAQTATSAAAILTGKGLSDAGSGASIGLATNLWRLASYVQNDELKTQIFSKFQFSFNNDGTVLVLGGNDMIYGKWFQYNQEFEFFFDVSSMSNDADAAAFTILNGKWKVSKSDPFNVALERMAIKNVEKIVFSRKAK